MSSPPELFDGSKIKPVMNHVLSDRMHINSVAVYLLDTASKFLKNSQIFSKY